MNRITHLALQSGSNRLVGTISNFSMGIPTQTNNAESKVEKIPVAVFITTSTRRPASCSVTVSVEGHSL